MGLKCEWMKEDPSRPIYIYVSCDAIFDGEKKKGRVGECHQDCGPY